MFQACFSLGSSTHCLTWPSLLRVCLLICWFWIHPTLQHSHLHLLFPFRLFLVSFSLLVLSVLHSDFLFYTARCSSVSSATQKSTEKLTQRYRHPNEIKQSLPLGPGPVSSPSSTWPYCRRATDGLLAPNGRATDTETLSRSRCLLPLDICPSDRARWMGNGRQGRGHERGKGGWVRVLIWSNEGKK